MIPVTMIFFDSCQPQLFLPVILIRIKDKIFPLKASNAFTATVFLRDTNDNKNPKNPQ